jgi:hypothetical protein
MRSLLNMAMVSFHPFGVDSVIVKFLCPNCLHGLESEPISVPEPNWSAEKASESDNYNDGYAYCEECEKEFYIEVVAGFGGGWIIIEDLDEEYTEISIKELYEEREFDAILSNTEYFQTFKTGISNLKELCSIELTDQILNNILKRQIYIGAITCLETYLSDAFINSVMANEASVKKFVITFKDFQNEKLTLNNIYNCLDNINKKVKVALSDIIYHNLPKVNGMYRDTFGVKFPLLENMQKFINIRHDLVHRNGKSKDSIEIIVNNNLLGSLLYEIEAFVSCIDQQLTEKLDEQLIAERDIESHF